VRRTRNDDAGAARKLSQHGIEDVATHVVEIEAEDAEERSGSNSPRGPATARSPGSFQTRSHGRGHARRVARFVGIERLL
jgi:hypothetical protein